MTDLERLLRKLPKKYHKIVKAFEQEDDLVDDCKYMLYWNEGWTCSDVYDNGGSFPVKTIYEAVKFVKESLFEYKEN